MIAPDESVASQVEGTAAPEIQDLRSLTDAEVGEVLTGWGHKSYRTRQLLDWIYKKRVRTFDEMTDLSQVLRVQLSEAFRMQSLECAQEQVSSDGTVKFLWRLADGERRSEHRAYWWCCGCEQRSGHCELQWRNHY